MATTVVALSGFVLSGCGDDDGGNLFVAPELDGGDASAKPDHASDAKGGSTSDTSVADHVEPPADVAAGDALEDISVSPPDVTTIDAPTDAPAVVDASDTGTGTSDAGSDTSDTGAVDVIEAGPDAADAGIDASVTDASGDADAAVDAFDAGCDDGNACTVDTQLANGTCTHVSIVCTASDQCHSAGTCDPSNGQCSNPAKSNGDPCSDGNSCTQSDTCQSGSCVGANPIVCPAPDQCHTAGTCNPSNGLCSNPAKGDGATCDDTNGCTLTDTCQAGSCVGTNPKSCGPSDDCHLAGVCNPSNGACSNPTKNDGDGCNDNNACTLTDTCLAGVCTGGNPKSCPAPTQCHLAGVCNPSDGICSNPNKNNGDGCDDGNACTLTDTCQAGACTPGTPKVCTATECHDPGTCDVGTGVCSAETVSSDTPSPRVCTTPVGGRCSVGACIQTFMVVRVGDGSGPLLSGSVASPVFVERRYLDPVGAVIETIPMPTAANGSNQILTMSSSAGTEGSLSRSSDNRFVLLAGYAATVGTSGINATASSSTNRIVGRISADGSVDTSTRLNTAFSTGNNPRGATSTNGTDIWVDGSSNTTGGIHYTTLGALGSTMLIPPGVNPNSPRVIHIFGGNLYGTSNSAGFNNVFQLGAATDPDSGLPTPPTTAPQTAVGIPGMSGVAAGQQLYSFVFFDTDGTGGFDTLYVANDGNTASGPGIQKWKLTANSDGGAPLWTLTTTFTAPLVAGVRGLAGMQTSSGIFLIATTADTGGLANKILYYFDDGISIPTPTLIDTSATISVDGGAPVASSLFRGVALAP